MSFLGIPTAASASYVWDGTKWTAIEFFSNKLAGIRTVSASATLSTYEQILHVNTTPQTTSSLPIQLYAPSATDIRYHMIKKVSGSWGITLVRAGSETIDGIAANYTLSGSSGSVDKFAWTIWNDGTNWWVG